MDKKVLLISDEEYSNRSNGGAESNNNEIIKILNSSGIKCNFLTTHDFNDKVGFIEDYDLYIVSNFYFISRIIYALYAKIFLKKNPIYGHPLNTIASTIKEDLLNKDFSQIKTYFFKKK